MPLDSLEADTALAISKVRQSNPDLYKTMPGVALASAMSPNALDNADAAAGLQHSIDLSGISNLRPEDQAKVFQSLSPEQQTMMFNNGYRPEQATVDAGQNLTKKQGGFSLWHIISDVVHPISQVIGGAVKGLEKIPGVHDIFNTLGAPLRFVGHLERFATVGLESIVHPDRLSEFLTPNGNLAGAGLGQMWSATSDGEKFLWNSNYVKTDLDERSKAIGLDAAFGMKQDELALKYGASDTDKAINQPGFNDFVSQLNDQKVTIGHLASNLLGLHTGHMFHTVSGGLDAAHSWFMDPVNAFAGKAAKAREAYYTIDAGNVGDKLEQIYHGSSGVRNIIDRIPAMKTAEGTWDADKFLRESPELKDLAGNFAAAAKKDALNTPEDVMDVVKQGFSPIAQAGGRATGVGIPGHIELSQIRLTPGFLGGAKATKWFGGITELHDAQVAVKAGAEQWLDKASGWAVQAGDHVFHPLQKPADFLKHITTLNPPRKIVEEGFDPEGQHALEYVRSMALAQGGYKYAGDVVNRFAAADRMGKFNTYLSMVTDQVTAAAATLGKSVDDIPPLRDMLDKMTTKLKQSVYQVPGMPGEALGDGVLAQLNTLRDDLGQLGVKPGIPALTGQIPNGFFPALDYRQMVQSVRSQDFIHTHFGAVPAGLDWMMNHLWRPASTVLKAGFGVRVGAEEQFLEMLREGFLAPLKGALAKKSSELLAGAGKMGRVARRVDKVLPDGAKAVRDHIAQLTHSAYEKTAEKLLPEEYHAYATLHAKFAPGEGAPAGFSAGEKMKFERVSTIKESLRDKTPHIDTADLTHVVAPEGFVDTMHPGVDMWHKELVDASKGPELNLAVEHYGASHELAGIHATDEDAIEAVLRSKARLRARLEQEYRSETFREQYPNHPGLWDDPNFDKTVKAMATRSGNTLHALLTDAQGNPITEIMDEIRSTGHVPSQDWIAHNVPPEHWPTALHEGLHPGPGEWDHPLRYITNKAGDFQSTIIDGISRNPIYFHEAAKATKSLMESGIHDAWSRAFGTEAADRLMFENARDIALEKRITSIHDPGLRSQFAELHRNTIPFWFAHEQFVKRWGKAILEDPSIFRKAQLTMAGLRSVGIVHRDPNGDYFVMPGSGVLYQALSHVPVIGKSLGGSMVGSFNGRIKAMSAGLSEGGRGLIMPGVGPLVTVPMKALADIFPDLKGVEKGISPISSTQSMWQLTMPAWMANTLKAFNANEQGNQQFSSAVLAQIQELQADPKTALHENSSPMEKEAFLDRARQRARSILIMRAVTGFFAPVTPNYQYKSKVTQLNQEYQSLIRETGDINEATSIYLANHPNTTPLDLLQNNVAMTFQSQMVARGTSIIPSKAVSDFIDQHQGFISKYGAAATYFLPWTPPGTQYDPQAYRAEVATGLRIKRDAVSQGADLTGVLQQTLIARDADPYYKAEREYQQARAAAQAAGNTGAEKLITARWSAWKVGGFDDKGHWNPGYLTSRPVFAQYLDQAQQRADERGQILNNIKAALTDPTRPQTPHDEAMTGLLNAYDGLAMLQADLKGRRDTNASLVRKAAVARFQKYADGLDDPIAKMLYNSLMQQGLVTH